MKKRLISIFLIVSIIASIFAISAINTSATSTRTIPMSVWINPTQPSSGFQINWMGNAPCYKLYWQKAGTGAWSQKGYKYTDNNIKYNFQFINHLESGALYYFQFQEYTSAGKPVASYSKVFSRYYTSAPNLTGIRNITIGKNRCMNINWTKVKGATGYTMWARIRGTNTWQRTPGVIKNTYYNWYGLKPWTTFEIKISAIGKDGHYHSAYSNSQMWQYS